MFDRRGAWCIALALALAGCNDDESVFGEGNTHTSPVDDYPDATLDPGTVRAFAAASAPNVFSIGVVLLAAPTFGNDETCPVVTETTTQTVYEGGCTTADGDQVLGRAVVTNDADGGGTIDYQGFGLGSTEECKGAAVESTVTYTGTMEVTRTGTGRGAFTLDLVLDASAPDPSSCATVKADAAYEYAGDFTGSDDGGGGIDLESATTWNGSGRFGSSYVGAVDTTTEAELVDQAVCETEAASGTTTLRAGGDVAVISYDGASDCDPESTVTWTLNGADQGEMSDVRCSLGAPTAAPRWAALFGALAIGFVARRRR